MLSLPETPLNGVDQAGCCNTQVFAVKHYQPHLYEYPKFDGTFRRLLADAEAAAEAARRPTAQLKTTPATTNGQKVRF